MADQGRDNPDVTNATTTIATQARRIRELEQGAGDLRDLVRLADTADLIIGDTSRRGLLESIVNAARHIFGARAASIILLDQQTNELVFEAATDSESQDIVGLRFPAHQGIAGWVVMSGEPIAVSDVRRDPRFAKDFAQSTGYIPDSILAVPLIVREEVEGVLEVLDKAGASAFGLDDMEMLTLFARPAAIAVEQARVAQSMGLQLLRQLRDLAKEQRLDGAAALAEQALADETSALDDAGELARVVHEITKRGEQASRLAVDVLRAIERYSG
ncbi:MAG: GAF domain-containing protein [Chloroflexota bacterium]